MSRLLGYWVRTWRELESLVVQLEGILNVSLVLHLTCSDELMKTESRPRDLVADAKIEVCVCVVGVEFDGLVEILARLCVAGERWGCSGTVEWRPASE